MFRYLQKSPSTEIRAATGTMDIMGDIVPVANENFPTMFTTPILEREKY